MPQKASVEEAADRVHALPTDGASAAEGSCARMWVSSLCLSWLSPSDSRRKTL
jgi:hypothetical protein